MQEYLFCLLTVFGSSNPANEMNAIQAVFLGKAIPYPNRMLRQIQTLMDKHQWFAIHTDITMILKGWQHPVEVGNIILLAISLLYEHFRAWRYTAVLIPQF